MWSKYRYGGAECPVPEIEYGRILGFYWFSLVENELRNILKFYVKVVK